MVQQKEMVWRRIMDDLGFEHAYVRQGEAGPCFGGTVIIAESGAPLCMEYEVECDASWSSRIVRIRQSYLGSVRCLVIQHDGHGAWLLNGSPAPELEGCTDVDLGVTPSTNALPINRLALLPGQSATIKAAWVRFPSLDIQIALQTYQRLGTARYRYQSQASGFTAEVEVDRDGFPVDYSGVWLRIGEGKLTDRGPAKHANPEFAGALISSGPAEDMMDVAPDFGWLVGGWEAEVADYDEQGAVQTGTGEWWFSWVLEGRAIQDVWISPPRALRPGGVKSQAAGNRFGSSLRHFDRKAGLWRVAWTNPVTGTTNSISGRRSGNRIELRGEDGHGPIRWTFDDITENSFVWIGERQDAAGQWRLEAKFSLRRLTA